MKVRSRFFLLVIIITIAPLFSGCASMFADSLVYANRQPLMKAPSDYGLDYQNIAFETPDGVELSGWLIPGDGNAVVVMTHPMNFTRYGYSVENQGRFKITDIEVEFLRTAQQLNKAGYTVLMFDLRNHGLSGSSPDSIFGLGVLEWPDIIGALQYVDSLSEYNGQPIHFLSYCTGANATIIAMSKQPEAFGRVRSLAAIQPISTGVFVENFLADKYPIFTGSIPRIEEKCIEKGGLPFDELSPEAYMQDILVPVLIVQAEEDVWTDVNFIKRLAELAPEPKRLVLLPGEMHRFDTYNYFGSEPQLILDFFEANEN